MNVPVLVPLICPSSQFHVIPRGHEANSRSHMRRPPSKQGSTPQKLVLLRDKGTNSPATTTAQTSIPSSFFDVIAQMPMLASGLAVLLACVYSVVEATTQGTVLVTASNANASGQIQVRLSRLLRQNCASSPQSVQRLTGHRPS